MFAPSTAHGSCGPSWPGATRCLDAGDSPNLRAVSDTVPHGGLVGWRILATHQGLVLSLFCVFSTETSAISGSVSQL